MAIGRTNTGGGGGLNFQVVGNPQPNNAKENTIWIDTDIKITSWIFSATEPEAPVDGEDGPVWIATGTSSTIEFNALKKNGIRIYPISAKQYANGTWVDVEAKSYQGGTWVDWWNGYYFESGKGSHIGEWTLMKQPGASSVNYVEMSAEHILFQCGNNNYNGLIAQSPAVNLSGINKLYFDATFPNQNCTLGIVSQKITEYLTPTFIASVNASKTGQQVFELDVSKYNGDYYITVYSSQTGSGKVYNVWKG